MQLLCDAYYAGTSSVCINQPFDWLLKIVAAYLFQNADKRSCAFSRTLT
jgi:hypothetical protein